MGKSISRWRKANRKPREEAGAIDEIVSLETEESLVNALLDSPTAVESIVDNQQEPGDLEPAEALPKAVRIRRFVALLAIATGAIAIVFGARHRRREWARQRELAKRRRPHPLSWFKR